MNIRAELTPERAKRLKAYLDTVPAQVRADWAHDYYAIDGDDNFYL